MINKVILVFKTHFDIGFTDLAANVIDIYSNSMLDEVLATCKATQHMGKQQYVWTLPAWPLQSILQNASEDKRRELEALIERGQIAWHALAFTSHTDFCSAEEYIESLRFGRELSQQYNKPYPISAKMTDVPGHTIMLPAILSGAGVKFLHLGCNEFAKPPRVPFLFHWEALSGERVLTMYNEDGYGTALLPPEDWPFPVWMALMHTHDNCGPQSAEVIAKLISKIQARYPHAEVVCGTMDDFYNELSQHDLSGLPVIRKDLADTWIHGVGAYPKEVAVIRGEREKIKRLQALYARQLLDGSTASRGQAMSILDQYYEDVSLFEEHTWGADVKTWLGPDRVYEKELFLEAKPSESYQFMEASWEEQRERARRAAKRRQELKELLERDAEEGIYLFNPNNTSYTGWVVLESGHLDVEHQGLSLRGQSLPVAKINGEWACYVQDLPPLSTVQLTCEGEKLGVGGLDVKEEQGIVRVENHRYALTFSHVAGEILSLFDKKLQAVLLEKRDGKAVLSYQYDRYGIDDITEYLRSYAHRFSTWGIQDNGREAYPSCTRKTFVPKFEGCLIEGHTVTLRYRGTESVQLYGDAEEVVLHITLPPVGDEVFVKLDVVGKQETPYVESGSLLFPCAAAKDYRINKTNVVLDPAADIQAGANHVFYCLENYLSVEGGGHGLCIVTHDVPLASVGNPGVYQYVDDYTEPESPVVYFNLFNNMWGTNFPQWIGGDFSFRFTLFGFEGEERPHLLEKAAALRLGVETTGRSVGECLVELPEHMQLINVRQHGAGLVVRFKDLLGKAETRRLEARGFAITPVDLNNQVLGETYKDTVEFAAKPYGICSFLLQKTN